MNTEALFSSKSDEWETPDDLFAKLDKEFKFTLDPCATAENHKCDRYYTAEQNGLEKSWGGRLYSAIRRIHRLPSGLRKPTMRHELRALSAVC